MAVKFEIINGKRFDYECSCRKHDINCLTEAMWEELENELDSNLVGSK